MSSISRRTAALGIAASFVSPTFMRIDPATAAVAADANHWNGAVLPDGWVRIPIGLPARELYRIRAMTARPPTFRE